MLTPDPTEPGAAEQSFEPAGSPAKALRIFIADDHEMLRAGVRRLIETHEGWEVCGEAADGTEVAKSVRDLGPTS
ncbi:MAG: response regulator transcription factor [Chthoniobacterales bacterium]